MQLQNSIAIITGASKGLGAEISAALVQEGAIVYGIARGRENLEKLQVQLGSNFIPVPLDISDRQAVNNWVSDAFDTKTPQILINNAGIGAFARIDEMDAELWDQMLKVNLSGVYNITAPIVSKMRTDNKLSYIINIGSILGVTTRSEGAAYSATKYGIQGFSESLMKELRGDRIKVTCLNPGSIETDFFESSGIQYHANMLQPKALAETIIFLLKTPDNFLIDELRIRPLDSRNPNK